MESVRSKDGTTIGFVRLGSGPPLVLVAGASCDRAVHGELAELLAEDFTVFNYDRRGRGDSGDTLPYAVEREVEDLDAVITTGGGEARVFGNSSGAVLALRAAAAGVSITKLALWEPPLMTDPDAPQRHEAYVGKLIELLNAGHHGDAMALFLKTIGMPDETVTGMRQAPMWAGMETLAPTLLYDAFVMGDSTLPTNLVTSVKVPTLVLDGSDTGAWAAQSAIALEEALPNPERHTFVGQNHAIAWGVLAPVLKQFFGEATSSTRRKESM